MALGTIMIGSAPAFAWGGSNTNVSKKIQSKNFASAEQALREGVEDLKAGRIESSVAALMYAAKNGEVIARWKLGELYAVGDGVSRDDSKARIPASRFGDPAEFGALCAFLASAHAGFITGQNILIDGGAFPGAF